MIEFKHLVGDSSDASSISEQFNEWFKNKGSGFSNFRVIDANAISVCNSYNQHIETMYILYEYE